MPEGFLLNPAGLIELMSGRDGLVYRDTMLRAERVMSRAKVLCPVKTGRLRGSIRIQPMIGGPAGFHVQVGTDVDYAAAVHEGTRPHTIVPKTAKVLAFTVGGQKVFATRVNHPGSRGKPFLRDALPAAVI